MRWTLLASLSVLAAAPSFATPPDFAYASGFAVDDTKIVVRETYTNGTPEFTFVRADVLGNQLSKYFLLEKECSWRAKQVAKESVQTLVCRVNNKSPLSGVTYQAIRELVPSATCGQLAYTLKCTSGCRRSVPKELYAENC